MRMLIYLQTIFLCLILVFLNACQKEAVHQKESDKSETVNKIVSWLEKQKTNASSTGVIKIESLIKALIVSKTKAEQLNEKERVLIVPLEKFFIAGYNEDKVSINVLVLIENDAGEIRRGNIVKFVPESGEIRQELSPNTFQKIYANKPNENNGVFSFLSILGNFRFEFTYKRGKMALSKTYGSKKPPRETTGRTETETCWAWYLITTHFNFDGTTETTEQYLYTTCDNCDPTLDCYDHEEGGGGGDGDAFEFEEERSKFADYEWIVQSIPGAFGGGVFYGYQRLVAKFYTRNTQNNRFIGGGQSHINLFSNSWGQNGTISYSNTSSTVVVNSNTVATISSSGTIQFLVNNITYDYSGSKSVTLSECAWQ